MGLSVFDYFSQFRFLLKNNIAMIPKSFDNKAFYKHRNVCFAIALQLMGAVTALLLTFKGGQNWADSLTHELSVVYRKPMKATMHIAGIFGATKSYPATPVEGEAPRRRS